MSEQPVTSLKGIGEKTGKLFEKLGIRTVGELLEYYPRGYDAFDPPVPIGELKPDTTAAVEGMLKKDGDVRRFSRVAVTVTSVSDGTGTLQLTWYNMPFLRGTLKAGSRFVFRGRVVKKNGRMTMEQPEIYSLAAYESRAGSMPGE